MQIRSEDSSTERERSHRLQLTRYTTQIKIGRFAPVLYLTDLNLRRRPGQWSRSLRSRSVLDRFQFTLCT